MSKTSYTFAKDNFCMFFNFLYTLDGESLLSEKKTNKLIWIFVFSFIFHFLNAQQNEGSGQNLPNFYQNRLHFGFTIAFNSTDFRIHTKPIAALPDTIIDTVRYNMKNIYHRSAPGFALGIVSDFRLHDYVRIRFTPNISFASRSLEYHLSNRNGDSTMVFEKSVESTFLIFPLEVKIQSKRAFNFSAYVIGGGGYAMDLAGNKKSTGTSGSGNVLDNTYVKLYRDDFFYSGGGGVDFYLKYFKFGLELKILAGTRNLLYQRNNIFSQKSIDKVNSRMVVFTLTFEG